MAKLEIYRSATKSNAQNTVYPFRENVESASELCEVLKFDHVCAQYKENKRSEANFISSAVLAMDCDNDHSDSPSEWKTPDDVKIAFPNVCFGVGYSRNHNKEKNGKAARPKFHVYFPIKPVTDAKVYAALKRQVLQRFPYFDANALDAARFYFGSENNHAEMIDGEKTVDEILSAPILEGSRNSTLSQKAGKLVKRYGVGKEAYEQFLKEAKSCVPPLPDAELNSIWNSAAKFWERVAAGEGYIPPEQYKETQPQDERIQQFLRAEYPEKNKRYSWSDIGAAALFADCYVSEARYVPERKSWYIYENGVWSADVGGLQAMELCKILSDELIRYALTIKDEQLKQEYLKYCNKWQSRHTRETILKDAQGVHPVAMSEFDENPFIFNCKNGTLHLDTMQFLPHSPEDRLTKISEVEYHPEATCDRFDAFINEICSGDQGKARFLQKAMGYGITGDTRYECLFFLYGSTTRNGKGTLCESVLKVLGNYGCTARPETISLKPQNSQNPSEDIARLAGIRFVNISEPGKSLVLNAAQIKTMTGNDTLNARFLHENSFDFKPQFKLYINTNYLPGVNDMTLFSSERVIIIPFDRHFEENEQDRNLKTLFAQPESQSAILNWLIEGYEALTKEGFEKPESVRNAIESYRYESDKIAQFIVERLQAAPDAETRTSVIYEAYRTWCTDNGLMVENARNVNQALRQVATVIRKRPVDGGAPTTVLQGYKIIGAALPL